jgi:SNF2 family DNA or RNA helicase
MNLSKSTWDTRIVLTGTPVRNYADEVYNLLHFVAPQVPYFRNFESFSGRYLTRDWKALWNPGQFHLDIKPFYLRRTVAEVQKDLPKHRITKLYTEITDPYIKQLYNKELDALDNFMTNGRKMCIGDEDSGPQSLLGYLIKLRHWTGIAKAKEPAIIEPIADYLLADDQRFIPNNGSEPKVGNKVAIGLIHHFVADRLTKSLLNLVPMLNLYHIRGGQSPIEKFQQIEAFQNGWFWYRWLTTRMLQVLYHGTSMEWSG